MCVQRISSVDTERMCVCTLAHFRTYVGYTTRYAFLLIVEDMQKSVYSWDPCAFEMATVLLFVSKTLQYVCVCVVGKGITFLFLLQSLEVKTLPCASAVRDLL